MTKHVEWDAEFGRRCYLAYQMHEPFATQIGYAHDAASPTGDGGAGPVGNSGVGDPGHDVADAALIAGLQAGDEAAFNAIYRRYYQRLYFFAMRFVGSDEAKDVVAEAFIQLWNRRADFVLLAAVQHFLFVTVRNKCFNHLRRELMKLHKQAELLHQLETSDDEDLEIEQLRTALVQHIYEEAEKLPERQKEIFLLSFSQGLKPGEIAEQLGLSVQTVRNQKLTALKVLKAALGQRSLLLSLLLLLYAEG